MALNEKLTDEVLRLTKIVLWIILIVGSILILKFFGDLLKPLVIALIFWYLIKILSNFFTRYRIGKFQVSEWLAKLLALALIIFAVYIIVDVLVVNLKQIVAKADYYNTQQDNMLGQVAGILGMENLKDEIIDLPGSKELRPLLTSMLNSITQGVSHAVIIFIYLVLLLVEEFIFKKKIHNIYRHNMNYRELNVVLNKMNNSIKRYIKVKTFTSFLTAFLGYWILFFMGVDFPLLWAFMLFLFNYIPYIGSFFATLLPSMFAAMQFNAFAYFFWTFLFIQIAQILVANVIEPRIVGKSLNLSPLVVFLTLIIWGTIWGILGMIIAVPVTSIIVIILAQFPETQNVAVFLSQSGDINKMIVPESGKENSQA